MNKIITFLDIAEQWQIGFQDPATFVIEDIINFHHDLMFFLIITTIFVCWLLFRCISLFNEEKKEIPTTFVHGFEIEIIWSIIIGFFCLFCLFISIDDFAYCYPDSSYIYGGETKIYNCSYNYEFPVNLSEIKLGLGDCFGHESLNIEHVKSTINERNYYSKFLEDSPSSINIPIELNPNIEDIYNNQINNNLSLNVPKEFFRSNDLMYQRIQNNQYCYQFHHSMWGLSSKEQMLTSQEIIVIARYLENTSYNSTLDINNLKYFHWGLDKNLQDLLAVKISHFNFLLENKNGSLDLTNEGIRTYTEKYNKSLIPHKNFISCLNELNLYFPDYYDPYKCFQFFAKSDKLNSLISFFNKK